MGKLIPSIGGGGAISDECTSKKEHLLAGYTAITSDSDDEPIEGTMPERTADNVSINTENGTITIPAGHYKATTKAQANKGEDGISVSAAGVISLVAGWYNAVTKALSTFGAQAIAAGASEKTIETRGKWGTGNITIAAEPAIPAQYLKKGYQHKMADGRVITGIFEGWVPEPQDLYYNGVNSYGIKNQGTAEWNFENTRMLRNGGYTNTSGTFIMPTALDVKSYSSLIIEGNMGFSSQDYKNDLPFGINKDSMGNDPLVRITCSPDVVYKSITYNISQLTTIPAGVYVSVPTIKNQSYITRIRLA